MMLSASLRTTTRRLFLSRYASTLVLSEPLTEASATPPATQSAVTAALQLASDNNVVLLTVGATPPSQAPTGVSKVVHASTSDHPVPETVAAAIQKALPDDCTAVVGTSTKFGSTVIPRAAALLNASPVTDITEIVDAST